MKTPYSKLKRGCQYLHGFESDDLKKFIEVAKISEGMVVLDAMCGNGVLSKELSKLKNINLNLLDNSKFQIEIAKKSVKNAKFFVESILKTQFEKEKFDRVFIRNGVYEFPKNKQVKLYKEVLRILKDGGIFLVWVPLLNKNNHKFFQNVVRFKDKLAGYDDLVENRYFMTKEEFSEDVKKAGFSDVRFFDLNIKYIFSTKKWCEVDFRGDKEKLKELNEYIRSLGSGRSGIKIKDSEGDIQLTVPAMISAGRKK